MYPNVRAEFARKKLTLEAVSEQMGITIGTLSAKLRGLYPLTLNEAKKIKEIIGTNMTIDDLFEIESETEAV